jgi:hypothetical protein
MDLYHPMFFESLDELVENGSQSSDRCTAMIPFTELKRHAVSLKKIRSIILWVQIRRKKSGLNSTLSDLAIRDLALNLAFSLYVFHYFMTNIKIINIK